MHAAGVEERSFCGVPHTKPSSPIAAISVDAPSAVVYSSDMIEVMGKRDQDYNGGGKLTFSGGLEIVQVRSQTS